MTSISVDTNFWLHPAGLLAAFAVFILFTATTAPADAAQPSDADPAQTIQLKIPKQALARAGETAEKTKTFILDRLEKKIEKRLEAAQIKHATVRRVSDEVIKAIVQDDGVTSKFLASLLVPAGHAVLARLQHRGTAWLDATSQLPAEVELQQKAGSLDPNEAYLWSKNSAPLRRFLSKNGPFSASVSVYPHDGGWRTVAYGEPLATNSDIESVAVRESPQAETYVWLTLSHSVGSMSNWQATGEQWVLAVDGEVVAVFHPSVGRNKTGFAITPPSHTKSPKAQLRWARQIAGRIRAPYPFALQRLP